jgi:CheY-like chemotaxis protein
MEKTVLIVDDDKDIVTVLKLILAGENYSVLTASTGVEGYHMATTACPDLILMDYMLPDMNGDEVTVKIRNHLKSKSMPILLISAAHNAEIIAKTAGMDGFIPKPFEMEKLLEEVKKYMLR